MTTFFLIVLSLLVVVLAWGCINLLRKEEKYIDRIEQYNRTYATIINQVNEARTYLEYLDEKGYMRTNDEVGWYYGAMLDIQKDLDDLLNLTYGEEETEEQREREIFHLGDGTSYNKVQ